MNTDFLVWSTPKKKAELQSARVMDRIVSESIDPDGNSDEELDVLRKILKGTEDGRQKEEDKLVMKRKKEEEKARLRKQIEEKARLRKQIEEKARLRKQIEDNQHTLRKKIN
jgi:hypothetical protein